MIKQGVVVGIAIAAVFVAGFWLGTEKAAQGVPKGKVFELRTYTANEGRLPELQARFKDHTMKIFEKHGMKNVGYWIPTDAPASQNTFVYILSFPDRDAAKKSWGRVHGRPGVEKGPAGIGSGRQAGRQDRLGIHGTD